MGRTVRIGVFSDSHGDRQALRDAVRAAGVLNGAIFLGDYAEDAQVLVDEGLPTAVVRGNNDFGSLAADELTLEEGGARIFCTHGHRYGVYFGTDKLYYRAREKEAKVALFGHTHRPLLENNGGLLIVNPGSVSCPRAGKPTYAILEIRNGEVDADIRWVYG